jgi:hypothetical protein
MDCDVLNFRVIQSLSFLLGLYDHRVMQSLSFLHGLYDHRVIQSLSFLLGLYDHRVIESLSFLLGLYDYRVIFLFALCDPNKRPQHPCAMSDPLTQEQCHTLEHQTPTPLLPSPHAIQHHQLCPTVFTCRCCCSGRPPFTTLCSATTG